MPDKQFSMPVVPFSLHDTEGKPWTFFKPAHLDYLMDQVKEEQFEKDGFLPYWADNWPTSQFLFEYLSSSSRSMFGIIGEIGCGLGIISTLLARRGQKVIALDVSPDACRFAAAQGRFYNCDIRAVCCDWRHGSFKPSFDFIVGSDILYEERWKKAVVSFLSQSLKPGGISYIADPCRKYWDDFKHELTGNNLSWQTAASGLVNEGKTKVEILQIGKS
ncbi:MAG: class I SAM-dependent methyltransferase [Chitinivibrionales bacterium]|nr:class I SAM-dependent methyltransferase [Chitinivibrionales bacterium]